MHYKSGVHLVIIVKLNTMILTSSSEGGNYHDFDLSSERIHYRCRTNFYPFSVERLAVPDGKVRWDTDWSEYKPPVFTSRSTRGQPWADPDLVDKSFHPEWNGVDGSVNRLSYVGNYSVSNRVPINPIGRTGLGGRGVLGRWGPNHAADAVVTRWKRKGTALVTDHTTDKPILQLISIQKRSGEWGIPGGMVESGESEADASKREFLEEVLAYDLPVESSDMLDALFTTGIVIYKGYVDDPRNTDNAWVETVAFHYHDDSGQLLDGLRLVAGDDAHNVTWMDVDRHIKLFSAHHKFVREMTSRLNAHF